MFHRRDNHRLEVLRCLKGIKVIDHLTQVEDHAINRQLRHPARRFGKGHLLPARFLIIVSAKPRSSAASAIPSIMSTAPPDKWNITTPMHP